MAFTGRRDTSTAVSLSPVTQNIARGNDYNNVVAVESSGEAYQRALLTANFLTALQPPP